MKTSIIIPTYNEEGFIESCLKSLDNQSLRDFEVIVVDDGSIDKTESVLSNLQFTNFNLQILRQKHRGPALARNLGAKKALGEILVFVDADMTFDKDFVKKLIAPIIENQTIGTFSKEEYVVNWNNLWARCWNINSNLPSKKRLPGNYPNKQKVFRAILKKEFDRVGGFDRGGYTDDWSLSEKLGKMAVNAKGAKFYHKNPETFDEVFRHSRWVAKRGYKLGIFGFVVALVRLSLPVTILVGLYKSIRFRTPLFFIFKLVYNTGATLGIFEYFLLKKGEK
ncbi:MAG: hypothetical protein UV74_C0013G0308 [Candidatus Woesebacteria bacterium GW2011_GWB1_43_14]|uniref:Glycosyltransferase 2-like domain-containing protein n=1 Tax=Candidatus Woesebacteria bacterium GW2011_GWB1_43_14 TaxID=1618578 RepID=A0A0G1FQ86_9BACT|nr:MAG: hypothetical protein UT21_C0001G0018 [Candidatus Woesebacteria bacterium GW2011_GWA1_39_11b]KKS78397.1 MAG: hypothetical protein UV51_C0001G0113 [Candidatus Woesebacteria bacterium GW2011_GWC1_42_9]KKS97186.1 MAG: hypothetical protein UV74_C0013G0308 [Candidatus Woesebacteria bacterium GW2011_GWB1_43_14]